MCKLMKEERSIVKMQVDELKPLESYDNIYDSQSDISELIERLQNDPNDYTPLIIDENCNVIVGIETWRAFKQIYIAGTKTIKVSEKSFSSDEEKILAMIENHSHHNSSNEELCRATYAYYESYRRCYEKGHEFYLTGKQLYKILPNIFEIKQVSNRAKNLSGSCYEDYISVGRKIHELEEQNDYDNLECLLIRLEDTSPLTIRHECLLSQICEWTDEIRAEIRRIGREKGVSKNIVSRIAKKKAMQQSNISDETTDTSKPIDVVADLWDEERDRTMNSYVLLNSAYESISNCFRSVKSVIEYEPETEMTSRAREEGYRILSLLEEMTEYVTKRFSL